MALARPVRADELDELLELYQTLNPEDPELDRDDALREQWREMVRDDDLEIVVVEHHDRLVATCVLAITPNLTRGARPFALIENVVTHEAYRGEGFGSRCLERAIDVARERDCYKVLLSTGADAEWKLDFYEDCGFDRDEKTGFVYDLREE